MDFASLMSNPMVGQLMQRLQSDPSLMARLQGVMADPASAQQAIADDPELAAVMQQFMGGAGGGGGGGGGMGGGGMGGMQGTGGGFGNNPWGSAASPNPAASASSARSSSSSSDPSYVDIHSDSQYQSAVAAAGKRLVVVDVTASWCGPCKRIAPVFAELSSDYKGRCVFLKVDGDENPALMRQLGCSSFPTFLFLVDGKEIERFSGADKRRLRAIVREHGEKDEVAVCPYRHFPLRESEQVKYVDMKWEAVEGKLDEYNAVVGEPYHLSELERAELDVIIQKLQNKLNYHSSTFNDAQYKLIQKLLGWPKEYVGPVLNVLRLFVLHPHVAERFSKEIVEEKRAEEDVVSRLLTILSTTDKPVTAMLAIRVLCNFFSRHVLSKAMGARYESIFDALATVLSRLPDDNLRASAFALYINYTLLFAENSALYEAGKVQLLSSLPEQLRLARLSSKLVYRLLVVLGTLLYGDATAVEMAVAIEVPAVVAEIGKEHAQDAQVRDVAKEIEQVLSGKK